MNEREFGFQIKHHLDRGLDLDAATLQRLRLAREESLRHQRQTQSAFELAWAGAIRERVTGHPASASIVLGAAALILGLIGIQYWHRAPTVEEIAEIDTALLTSDLPINAYLDKSFDTWLKRSQH